MSDARRRRLTNLDCIMQAEECRQLARAAFSNEHRITLNQIAKTFERIASDIEVRARRSFLRLV